MRKILLLVFLLGIFSGCVEVAENGYCEKDSDCVEEQCCHPTSCVNREFKPNCQGIFCSEECKKDSMDCGCGHCSCLDNKCQVTWTKDGEWC